MNDLIFQPDNLNSGAWSRLRLSDTAPFSANVKKILIEMDYEELRLTGWWDNRFFSPIEATMAYADAFGPALRKMYARDFDYERAQYISTASGQAMVRNALEGTEKGKRYINGFWRGRQVADALEMPYKDYIEVALDYRMSGWAQPYAPKPWNLYTDWIVDRVAARWEELKASKIYYANHEAYLPGNFRGLRVQVAYYDYLIERARRTTFTDQTIATMIADYRISYEEVAKRLSYEEFQQVRSSLS